MEELTVTELSNQLKRTVEQNFGCVCIKAEISAFKISGYGHAYFVLKDEQSIIKAVCWKWTLAKQKIKLEDGLLVKCFGSVSIYSERSEYQFVMESCVAAGIGDLLKMLAERKQKLAAEGLFSRIKKPIPKIPRLIGIITSPTGAVIEDMKNRISGRFPRHVLLWPVLVQGTEAAKQIVEAIQGMNRLQGNDRPDVIIVARGGGSFEDLMPFNDESIVRAVAASDIPIISAVGHETDTTLIDYASDLRAPTPSAAAEFVVPDRKKLRLESDKLFDHLKTLVLSSIKQKKIFLTSSRLINIKALIMQKAILSDSLTEKMQHLISTFVSKCQRKVSETILPPPNIENIKGKLNLISQQIVHHMSTKFAQSKQQAVVLFTSLEANSYTKILKKGFALVENTHGKAIISAEVAEREKSFRIIFQDGSLDVLPKPMQKNLF